MYAGDLKEEEEVLQWLITQRTEDRIELVTRSMLETIVQETQYLAVYFCKCNQTMNLHLLIELSYCSNKYIYILIYMPHDRSSVQLITSTKLCLFFFFVPIVLCIMHLSILNYLSWANN